MRGKYMDNLCNERILQKDRELRDLIKILCSKNIFYKEVKKIGFNEEQDNMVDIYNALPIFHRNY